MRPSKCLVLFRDRMVTTNCPYEVVSIILHGKCVVKALQGADGRYKGFCGIGQRKTGLPLLRQIRHMDEAAAHIGAGIVMQHGIEHIVAHEGACGIGDGGGQTGFADGCDHGLDG